VFPSKLIQINSIFNHLIQDAKKLQELSKKYNDTKIFVNPDHNFILVYINVILI